MCIRDQPQLVPQPLNHGSAHEHTALHHVSGPGIGSSRKRRNEAVAAQAELLSQMHQQETAGSIGVFHISLVKAGLAEQRLSLIHI